MGWSEREEEEEWFTNKHAQHSHLSDTPEMTSRGSFLFTTSTNWPLSRPFFTYKNKEEEEKKEEEKSELFNVLLAVEWWS